MDPEQLLRACIAVEAGQTVTLTYEGNRSDRPLTVTGRAMEHPEFDKKLYLRTDGGRGDVYIEDDRNYMGQLIDLRVRSTRGPFSRGTTLGQLISIEVG